MLNIIRKKPRMNGDVLRDREREREREAPTNMPDAGGGTAVKNSRDEYIQRQNVLNHQN